MKRGWIGLMALMMVAGCSNDEAVNPGTWYSYRNPVEQSDVQDPSVYEENGKFYLFSAVNAGDVEEGTITSIIPIMESTDLTTWQRSTSVFDEISRPTFIKDVMPTSPEITLIGERYVLYYSLSKDYTNSGIGYATSDLISGPYTDRGKLIQSSSDISGVSSPSFIQDDDANYLVFGNFNGIYLVRLSADGLSTMGSPVQIASYEFDAPCIFKHEDKYYLFATVGTTDGEASCTCTQVVGRADRIEGPYKNKGGEAMTSGYSELLIGSSAKFVGAGHGTVFDVNDGTTWILYNAYDMSNVKKGRTLMLDRIMWVGGWPSVRGQIGSFCADSPLKNK
ncbi:MAG: hypothetical protein E7111_02030 [Bacteroidales bacterium]|nr:hypothetical protein [Bacteroidales bacterium]